MTGNKISNNKDNGDMNDFIDLNDSNINKINSKGALEHKGELFYIDNSLPEYNISELWFVVKTEQKNENSVHFAKIWSMKNSLGCIYDTHIEECVQRLKNELYCL